MQIPRFEVVNTKCKLKHPHAKVKRMKQESKIYVYEVINIQSKEALLGGRPFGYQT